MEYSVHLQNFPNLDFISINSDVVRNMDKVREICNCVLALRKEENIRVRMPLKKITICDKEAINKDYLELIKQEVNTKEIEIFSDNIEQIAEREVILNMKECGKLFGSKLKDILTAQKQKQYEIKDGKLHIAGLEINEELFKVVYKSKNNCKILSCQSFNTLVMIDIQQDNDLIIEGFSRDFVRIIQQIRKENNYQISDRIKVIINTNDNIFNEILLKWKDYICEQTLCKHIEIQNNINQNDIKSIEEHNFSIDISKIS